ncbi:MBOAT, membrane-bound O-acyltransferase family-domain-containing protein [Paraphysoderma sedebokerense]|nr:MBOAT, membrane-bound O-acyltransferase family-domain-containing protein [Paraphysoderma sedebokerense]
MIDQLSSATGIPEPSLRLLIGLLAGYPIALFSRSVLLKPLPSSPIPEVTLRNLYNTVTGLAVAYLFCGREIIHSLITVVGTWLICALFSKQRSFACALSFVFNCGYLLTAYYFHASDEYDLNWTTPQSVLCLRLIGYGFDFKDGGKTLKAAEKLKEKLKDSATDIKELKDKILADDKAKSAQSKPAADSDNKIPLAWAGDLSLPKLPSLLETLGYAYFYGSFLVGPQFSFSLYKKYITLEQFKVGGKKSLEQIKNTSTSAATRTFLIGVFYLGITQVLQVLFPSSYVVTSDFASLPYLGVWKLTEGSCQLACIGFNGLDSRGEPDWSGLLNINIWKYETATALGQIIANFNVNTNHWAKLYLFKRLRFLGNKNLSALGTLGFLSIWHGFHPGYAFAFSLEFIDMETERALAVLVKPYTQSFYEPNGNKVGRYLHSTICYIMMSCGLYYAALGFDLLTASNIIATMNSLYWSGHIAVAVLYVFTLVVKPKRVKVVKKE